MFAGSAPGVGKGSVPGVGKGSVPGVGKGSSLVIVEAVLADSI